MCEWCGGKKICGDNYEECHHVSKHKCRVKENEVNKLVDSKKGNKVKWICRVI